MSMPLSGFVEVAERTVKTSHKGQRPEAVSRLNPRQQLLFAADRSAGIFVGHIHNEADLDTIMPQCTSVYPGKSETSLLHKLNRTIQVAKCTADRNLLHANNAEKLMSLFSREYARMRGVATAYLHLYAVWYGYLRQIEDLESKGKVRALFHRCL
jgi:hypothetical protein